MKYVIYKSKGDFYITTKQNYESPIQNAREITKIIGFRTAEEIIDYYCKNIKMSRDNFIVINGGN